MRRNQQIKVILGPMGSQSTAATSDMIVDTLGFNFARVDSAHDKSGATNESTKFISYALQDGTTTDVSNFTNISGALGSTNAGTSVPSTSFQLPVHNDTDTPGVLAFFVDMTTKERYLRIVQTNPETTSETQNVVTLFNAEDGPDSNADWSVPTATGIDGTIVNFSAVV